MSTFARSGHWRTNQNGTTFWVSGHNVRRDNWPSGIPRPAGRIYEAREVYGGSLHGITIPNARCPECHLPVFFFMAYNGGRVFFDELGPPWPKHPCTDSGAPTVQGFDGAASIERWIRSRRALHGNAPEHHLAIRPGYIKESAKIVRRGEDVIAIVSLSGEKRAFVIESDIKGKRSIIVYFKPVGPKAIPERLHYTDDRFGDHWVRVLAEVDVPSQIDLQDLPAFSQDILPEIRGWLKRNLPEASPLIRVRKGKWEIGFVTRLGRSRLFLFPATPWFIPQDEFSDPDWLAERNSLAKRQVNSWSRWILRKLEGNGRIPKRELYRDVFVWFLPGQTRTADLSAILNDLSVGSRPVPLDVAAVIHQSDRLPSRNHAQALQRNLGAYRPIQETKHSFAELAPVEHALLAKFALSHSGQWLERLLAERGLTKIRDQLITQGVRFVFMGTKSHSPKEWGYQLVMRDGFPRIVMLHLSSRERGMAVFKFAESAIHWDAAETLQFLKEPDDLFS